MNPDEGLTEHRGGYPLLDDEQVCLPVADDSVSRAADATGIEAQDVRDGLVAHHRDLLSDGTVYGFILRLARERECNCICYTDDAAYLEVTADVWEREREWFGGSDAVFDALVDAHTREVRAVAEAVDADADVEHGYAVGMRYPVKSAAQTDAIDELPFRVAERAEFLEEDVGIDHRDAVAYATYETVQGDRDRGVGAVASVMGVDQSAADDAVTRVEEWSRGVADLFAGLNQHAVGNDALSPVVFGAVAAMREES